jgi:uridine monophosphate synthetase
MKERGVRPEADMTATLAEQLHELGAVQFGRFTLKSGAESPVYLDLRLLISAPAVLAAVAEAYVTLLARLTFDRLAAIPYAGLPIGTAVALAGGWPLVYPRKEAKAYGTGRAIEGLFHAGETVVVLDDVVSSGGSKLEAIAPLAEAGLIVRDVVVLVDRETGGRQELARAGYRLHSVTTLGELATALAEAGRIGPDRRDAVLAYLRPSSPAGQN